MSQKQTLRELDNASFLSPQALASPREETDHFTLPSESKRFMKQTSDQSQLPLSFINDTARLNLESQEPYFTQNNKWTTEDDNFKDQDPLALIKRLDRSNKSILKTTTGLSITPKRKTVTIHDENKEVSDRDSQQSDAVGAKTSTPTLPPIEQIVSQASTLQKLKTFFQRRVKRSDSDVSSDTSKFDPLQPSGPEMEQLRCLNSNLNEWESDQEKATRLRSRRKRSLKGTFGIPTRKRAPPSMTIPKYNGLGQQLSRWQIWTLSTLKFLKKNRLVLPPDGRVRLTWDLLGMVFILYEVIMIPLQISFTFDEGNFLSVFAIVIDAFFISDLLLNFNTGYYLRGNLVVDRSEIASNYLKSWFVLDFMASFPYTYILDAAGVGDDNSSSRVSQSTRIIRILRFFRFIRVIRLIRVLKLKNMFGKLESFINLSPALNALAGFLRLSAIILFIAHWIACIWHLIGDLENGSAANTWIIYVDMQDASWGSRYVASIYWAITTMITVGYGDIVPVTDLERVYVMFTMLLSSGIFAYSMNSINALLAGWNSENEEFKKTIIWVERYMRKMKLDVETRLKVKKYLEYTLGEMTYRKDDENKLMSLLSESLKDETIRKINKGVLNNCESLDKLLKRTFTDSFLAELIYYFQEKIYSPGEIIYNEGKEDEQAMYLVMSGSVELFVSKNELVLRTMTKGQHFGEIEFFTGLNRQWGARATDDFLSLFYIKRKEIIDVIDNFPNDKEKFFFLKDKLALYSHFTGINHKCYTCNKTQHTALHCPYTHYEFDREKFLQELNEESYRFSRSFVRRPRPKKRFENYKELENAAKRLSLEFSKEIEIHQNEILGHDITPNCRAFVKKDISAKRAFNLVMSAVKFSGGKGITIQNPPINEEDQAEDEEAAVTSLTKMSSIPKREKQQRAAIKRATKESPFETGFDQVQSYRNYFPHNNVETVLEHLNRQSLKQARKLSKVKQLIHKSLSVKAQKAKAALNKAKSINNVEEGARRSHDYGVGRIDFLQEEQEKVVITEISESEDEIENDFAQLRNLITPSMMMENNDNVGDTPVAVADENIFGGQLKERMSRELIKKGDFLPMSSFASSHTHLWHNEETPEQEVEQPQPPSLEPLKLEEEELDTVSAEQEISSALELLIKKHGSNFVKEILEKKS